LPPQVADSPVVEIPGEWNSRLHKRNLPPQVADSPVEIPGEWNSRLHKQNLPPQVADSPVVEIPGEWNSRLHKQNLPPQVEVLSSFSSFFLLPSSFFLLSSPIKNGASPKPAPPQIMLLLLINPTAP
ncbi:MAG: hypothetical protein ABI262_16045, partial [Microcoleus sp.]